MLITEKSDCPVRRLGSGNRMTFTHLGESWWDEWIVENAFVCWIIHPESWILEEEIIKNVSLPLNIPANKHHLFSAKLSEMGREAKRVAKELPISRDQSTAVDVNLRRKANFSKVI